MSASRDDEFGFAPDYDSPVPYMQRTREYYTAIGYTTPYRWAHYTEAPFQPLKKPLSQSRVTIITTAAPYDPAKGDQGPGAAYNGSAKFYQVYDGDTAKQHDLRISHIGYDRKHTTATDSGTWFPLPQLLKAAAAGRIGEVAPRFLFSDFPLGNSAGKPHDVASQAQTLELALTLLESASGPQTTMQSPLRWSEDASWKLDYNNVAQLSAEELARRRAEFDKQKEIARGNRAA